MSKNSDATIALLEKYFDIAFAAPEGIKKLRELILSLAMQGKLVPQDPSDQPASELLKDIEAEKKRLVKEGKIKQSKPLPEIKQDEVPYDLPDSWEWVRVIDIVDVGTGSTPATTNSEYYNGTIPWYTSSATNNSVAEIPDTFITELAIKETNCKVFPSGSLIIAMYGQGKTRGQISEIVLAGATNQAIAAMIFYESSQKLKQYIKYYFIKIYEEIRSIAEGAAQPNLNVGKIKETMIPLPPLAEQHRIVAKIDELMARCDELEKLRGDRDRKQITVHTATLDRLLIAKEQSNFNTTWQFITQHFSELYSVKENVTELRKAILQLAVMGKLVPQDPNEQPASELLKEIKKEKKKLVKKGKIKRFKPLPIIGLEEIPFKLPNSWQWVRLGEVTSKITDGEHQTPPRLSEGYRLLSAKNVRNGHLDFDNCDFISEESYLKSRERCCPEFNDLLIVSVGGTIGRSSLVPEDSFFALVRSVALIKPLLVNSSYLKYSMDSSLLQNSIHTKKRGGAQACLYLSEIEKFLFSLLPLAEQHRIVDKIDQLMVLCDKLEKQIDSANSKQTYLLNAVITKI